MLIHKQQDFIWISLKKSLQRKEKDTEVLEHVPGNKATKLAKWSTSLMGSAWGTGIVPCEEEELQGRPYNALPESSWRWGASLSLLPYNSGRKRGNGIKSHQERFSWIPGKTSSQRVVRHWNELPREAVESLSLELKTCGDVALRAWFSGHGDDSFMILKVFFSFICSIIPEETLRYSY